MADGDGLVDEDLLGIVVDIGVARGLMFLPDAGAAGAVVCRDASQVLEDTPQSDVDVGVDENRDEEDGDAPAVGEAISQVESVRPDPAPVAINVSV